MPDRIPVSAADLAAALTDSMPSRFADPEARALAAIVDRLAELEAETDGDAVRRVVRYLHRRYRDE